MGDGGVAKVTTLFAAFFQFLWYLVLCYLEWFFSLPVTCFVGLCWWHLSWSRLSLLHILAVFFSAFSCRIFLKNFSTSCSLWLDEFYNTPSSWDRVREYLCNKSLVYNYHFKPFHYFPNYCYSKHLALCCSVSKSGWPLEDIWWQWTTKRDESCHYFLSQPSPLHLPSCRHYFWPNCSQLPFLLTSFILHSHAR